MTELLQRRGLLNVINLFNYSQIVDPVLNIVRNPTTIGSAFGPLSTEGTLPRTMELGVRVRFKINQPHLTVG